MTRERKELLKQMDELQMQENAEYELGCGYCSQQIQEAFAPYWEDLHNKWAATYGRTIQEHMDYVFAKQDAALSGKVPYDICWGSIY